jgi:RNA polymerase sigma-70 factor (ECF subfamily)
LNFTDIYKIYYSDIFNYSLFLSKNVDTAKDLASETFYRAMTVKSDLYTTTIKSYLLKITYRLFIESTRRSKRIQYQDIDENVKSVSPSHFDDLQEIEERLKNVNDIDRTVFYLKVFGELTYDQISQITELSIPALKVKIFRIRKKLIKEVYNYETHR